METYFLSYKEQEKIRWLIARNQAALQIYSAASIVVQTHVITTRQLLDRLEKQSRISKRDAERLYTQLQLLDSLSVPVTSG